ncbi:MAG: hypothetical protein Q4E36_01035 [Bacillota bacterium]|nr:hypothetical protein [Bacillota bacterium]
MLNFIRAEFFRAKKSILIKVFIVAGIIIPALLLVSMEAAVTHYIKTEEGFSFLASISSLIMVGANLTSLVIIFIGKSNDYYRLLLSQGLSKLQIVVYDFVFYQLLVLALGLFTAFVCLGLNAYINYSCGVPLFKGVAIFFALFFYFYHVQIAINSLTYLLYYVFKSPALAYLGHYILYALLAGFITNLQKTLPDFLIKVLGLIFPLFSFFGKSLSTNQVLDLKIIPWLIIWPLLSIFLSYRIFARREV